MGGIVSSVEGIASSFISVVTGSENPGPADFSKAIEQMIGIATQVKSRVEGNAPKSAQQLALTPEKGHPSIMEIKIANLQHDARKNYKNCKNTIEQGVVGDDGTTTTNGFPNTNSGVQEASKTLQQSIVSSAEEAIGLQNPDVANAPVFASGFATGKFSPKNPNIDFGPANETIRLALNGMPDDAINYCISFVDANFSSYSLGSPPQSNLGKYVPAGNQFVYYISVVAACTPPRGTGYATCAVGITVKTGFT